MPDVWMAVMEKGELREAVCAFPKKAIWKNVRSMEWVPPALFCTETGI
jgi:hypothetical protein